MVSQFELTPGSVPDRSCDTRCMDKPKRPRDQTNGARPQKSLKNPLPANPAMAAVVADHVRSMEEIAGLLD